MNFGIIVFNQVEELDFVGPWEMLTMWSKHENGPKNCFIVSENIGPITCAKGLSINPHYEFLDCPSLDYLLIPGGQGTRTEVENLKLINFVSMQASTCKAILSVCTGSFILHAAGLLSGRKATTHWASLDRLRALGDVEVIEERFVQDDDVWTSAGVSAGIDLMLAFIAHTAGAETAGKVQSHSEYYPSPIKYGGFENDDRAPGYIKHS